MTHVTIESPYHVTAPNLVSLIELKLELEVESMKVELVVRKIQKRVVKAEYSAHQVMRPSRFKAKVLEESNSFGLKAHKAKLR